MHTITGHKVAMKYISKAEIQREKTKTRVRREFEYMRTLRHPHIIKLYAPSSSKDLLPSEARILFPQLRGHFYSHRYHLCPRVRRRRTLQLHRA